MIQPGFLSAYHEAGHAVIANYLGGEVLLVTIEPNFDDGPRRHGETQVAWDHSSVSVREHMVREIKVALAGPAAEMIYSDEQYEPRLLTEWLADWAIASSRVTAILPNSTEREQTMYLSEMVHRLIDFLSRDDVWQRVAELADRLSAHETLGSDEISELSARGVLFR